MPIKNQKGKNSGAWVPLVMALMLAVGFLAGLKSSKQSGNSLISVKNNKSTSSYKVDEVLGYISQRYVDSVDVDGLAERAIGMIVDSLDPHSRYLDAETVAAYRAKMDGEYVGIGIEFRILRDTIVVTDVLENSPAAKSGLLRGDQIIVVNQDTISGINLPSHDIYKMLKGEKGSVAKIQVKRCDGNWETINVERSTVHTKSIPIAHAIDDETVYIAIESFNANTSKEFLDLLEPYHEKRQLKNLIIDLRGNLGGYLQEAVKILNQFFDTKGKLLVYTEGTNSKKAEYKTAGRPYLQIEDIYVLIDENSASASEIVAGALQDLERGTIVGRRSFGKGLVQEQYGLTHGGHLKLTIAKYYTPSGRLIQKQLGSHEDYEDEFSNRAHSGEWLAANFIPRPDSSAYLTASGKKLYGSRGIVPDLFVPMDSSLLKDLAYEQYVLKEELAFDLFRKASCRNMTIEELENSFDTENWTESIRSTTDFENYGRLSSIPLSEIPAFKNHVKELINRYDGGKTAEYISALAWDPYISAVLNDMKSKHVKNAELTTSN